MAGGTIIFGPAAGVTINAVNLSSTVKEARLNYAAEMQDETSFGDTTRIRKAGLYDWSVDVTFNQDYTTGLVDGTLFSLVGATSFYIKLQPDTATVAASNPVFSGPVVLESYAPIGGAAGDLMTVAARFVSAGALNRATS